ncbi:MAG TPA: hypothetical protein VFP94_07955, partial [Terriglobales bacterium]|nr:hypothetical protein [Terriglobales bacterium]
TQTPPGTTIKAELTTAINTQHAHPGDTIQAVVRSDVKVHGQKLWPKGTMLTGTVLAVTPAESDKSPAHITLVFQQASGKGSAPQSLVAAITKVDQAYPTMPSEPPRIMPSEPQPNPNASDNDKMNTLGEMPVPSVVTDGVPNPRSSTNQPARIEVTHMDSRGSELLSSRGDVKIPSGTRIELKVLSPPGGSSLPLLF